MDIPTQAENIFVVIDTFVGVLKSSLRLKITFCVVFNGPHKNVSAVIRISEVNTGVL